MWSRLSSTRQADYAHCTGGFELTHCDARSTARRSDLDRGRVESKWSLDADPRSTSNPDARSRVKSPIMFTNETPPHDTQPVNYTELLG